jgi:phosphatidylserine/phosphatidylglycerophosphate/cardiolipin synthase-like enzyme
LRTADDHPSEAATASGDGPIQVRLLTDGGQPAVRVATELEGFLAAAAASLDIALYDVRLPGPVGDGVAGALRHAAARGVAVRLLYNTDSARPIPVPPPPRTRPELIEALPFPTRDVPGIPDLMHHKYVVRDGEAVWCGSANWTLDSWEREENVIVTVSSPGLAAAYSQDFDELWDHRRVERSGFVRPRPVDVGGIEVRPWFTPGHGPGLSHRIAEAIDRARRRVRIASPVITAGAILGVLAEVASDGRVDLAGVVDATQVEQVFEQWNANGNSQWKAPMLERVLDRGHFSGKRSTPYRPGSVHDYMHAKVTVADDTVFVGSFNLSRSGERNAEAVLEIADPQLADRLARFVDEIRARYPEPVTPPARGRAR